VDTYTVAAYWLRNLGKVKEAEDFLREGLRNNPDSYEILFELGRLYSENQHDTVRARNLWELAMRKWLAQEPDKKEPDNQALHDIVLHLAHLEENAGNLARTVQLLEIARRVSPQPQALDAQIAELRRKLAQNPPANSGKSN
jgi:tetratricopeptide (TPR) repeat protein